jgi:SAM-dependent methyltransferase
MEAIADWAAARSDKWRRQLAGMEAMLAPIDEPLIRALDLDRPMRIADAGCGAGLTTVEVLRRAPEGSVAHGFDLSPALIEVARGRTATTDRSLAFEIADMSHALPPAGAYDRVMSRLGIMFFNDPPAAFANLRRWLLPGGRIAFAVWGPMEDNAWMTVTRDVVSEVVALPPVDVSAPGPFRYGGAASLLALLRRAGFEELHSKEWRQRIPIGGRLAADAAAQFALASFSSFAELLTAAGGDALARARRLLAARFATYENDGAVTMNACVHIITGSRGR